MKMIDVHSLTLSCLVLIYTISSITATKALMGSTSDMYHVPTFSVRDLEEGTRINELRAVLGSTGLISVVGSNHEQDHLAKLRREGLMQLCECLVHANNPSIRNVHGVDSSLLSDGTKRTTLATATIGYTPLPLVDTEILNAGCSKETIQSMEDIRDTVARISHTFITAMDELLIAGSTSGESNQKALLYSDTGSAFQSLKKIVSLSQNLEHFHVYEKSKANNHNVDNVESTYDNVVLDLHTDAGLFLAFLPGYHCIGSDSIQDDSNDFYIRESGHLKRAVFATGSVGVMLGIGAEMWLHSPVVKLRATRHAVFMEAGQTRAWYGMMHTVPQDAVVQEFPKRTFADMRKSLVAGDIHDDQRKEMLDNEVIVDYISFGCGDLSGFSHEFSDVRMDQRRLGTVDDGTTCNNVTNFFCWMSCLDIPMAQEAADLLQEGNSLYCLNPELLDIGAAAAYDDCKGFVHNAACEGKWLPSVPGIPAYDVAVEKNPPVVVPVAHPVPAPVVEPRPVPVAAPRPVPVAAPLPVPVAAPRPVPVTAPRPVPVAAPRPVPVAAPRSAPVSRPVANPVAPPVSVPSRRPLSSPVTRPTTAPKSISDSPFAVDQGTPSNRTPDKPSEPSESSPSNPAPVTASDTVPVAPIDDPTPIPSSSRASVIPSDPDPVTLSTTPVPVVSTSPVAALIILPAPTAPMSPPNSTIAVFSTPITNRTGGSPVSLLWNETRAPSVAPSIVSRSWNGSLVEATTTSLNSKDSSGALQEWHWTLALGCIGLTMVVTLHMV